MQFQGLLPLALVFIVTATTGCQVVSPLLAPKQKAASNNAPSPKPKTDALLSKEFEGYRHEVAQRLSKDDFQWIDSEARSLRVRKERLPGGYFKLRALYKALEEPPSGDADSNGQWEDHIERLQRWVKKDGRSLTAMVGLGHAWRNYAWKARGGGYSHTISNEANEIFDQRLAKASQVLEEASSLDERCPEWYLVALWVGIGESWERNAFERIFQAGVELEPTYYYLYQAKATYLLPRWYGEEGESERFARESADKVGGHQGDIIFFSVYSQLLPLHGLTFMNTHQQDRPRLLDGFRSIDTLYGASPRRLNEACFFAFGSNEHQLVADLFNRIGEAYDPEVWRTKGNFDMFRKAALLKAKTEKEQQASTQSSTRLN